MIQQRRRGGIAARQREDGYHYGRSPLGVEEDDGELVDADNYDREVTTLYTVRKDALSNRQAARELGVGCPTVDRTLDCAGLSAFESAGLFLLDQSSQ